MSVVDGVAELFAEAQETRRSVADVTHWLGDGFATDGETSSLLQNKARYWLLTLHLRALRKKYEIERLPRPSFKHIGPRWPKEAPGGRRWTEAEERRLLLYAIGHELPWEEIARRMHRTKNACVTRYSDLKTWMGLRVYRLGARSSESEVRHAG